MADAVDYAVLDYRCDPRVANGPADDSYVATDDDGSVWQILPSGGRWTVFDSGGHRTEHAPADTPEQAIFHVLGNPLPSAFMADGRVEPADRNGTPVGWEDDPEAFRLWTDATQTAEVGYVWYDHDNETWWLRVDEWPENEWAAHDLLDDAFRACLGDPTNQADQAPDTACCTDGYTDCGTCSAYGYIVQAGRDGELGEDLCPSCGGRGWLVCCG